MAHKLNFLSYLGWCDWPSYRQPPIFERFASGISNSLTLSIKYRPDSIPGAYRSSCIAARQCRYTTATRVESSNAFHFRCLRLINSVSWKDGFRTTSAHVTGSSNYTTAHAKTSSLQSSRPGKIKDACHWSICTPYGQFKNAPITMGCHELRYKAVAQCNLAGFYTPLHQTGHRNLQWLGWQLCNNLLNLQFNSNLQNTVLLQKLSVFWNYSAFTWVSWRTCCFARKQVSSYVDRSITTTSVHFA